MSSTNYVRPHLDYGDVIFHTEARICEFGHATMWNTQIEKLESVQSSRVEVMWVYGVKWVY